MATFTQLITAPVPTDQERFGYSVAQRGDWLAVCNSPIDFVDGSASVYLYKYVSGSWTHKQTLTLVDAFSWSGYRLSIKLSPNATKLAIGTSTGNNNLGRVYLFDYNAGTDTWAAASVTPTLVSPSIVNWATEGYGNGGILWHFGTDIALTDDLLLVSQNPSGGWFGKAYAYYLRDVGSWDFEADVTPVIEGAPVKRSYYGSSLAIDESSLGTSTVRIAIARKGEHDYYLSYGTVYLWTRTGVDEKVWTHVDTLWEGGGHTKPAPGGPGDYLQFADGITFGEDKLIVRNDPRGWGAATLYFYGRNTGLETFDVLSTDVYTYTGFGNHVLSNPKTNSYFLLSNKGDDSNKGCVYLYKSSGITYIIDETIYADVPVFGGYFGTSLSLNTVVNKIAVGATTDVLGGTKGAVYLFDVALGTPPTADFVSDKQTAFVGEIIQFTNNSLGTVPLTYDWDFGDGIHSALENPSHQYYSSGVFTVILVTTNLLGISTKTRVDYINIGPVPVYQVPPYENQDLSVIDFPLRFCSNCDVVMTNYEEGLKNNIKTSVQTMYNGIPLFTKFGSRVMKAAFDLDDDALQSFVAQEVARSVSIGEPRVIIDPLAIKDDIDRNTVSFIFPYRKKNVKNWKFVNINIQSFKTDK